MLAKVPPIRALLGAAAICTILTTGFAATPPSSNALAEQRPSGLCKIGARRARHQVCIDVGAVFPDFVCYGTDCRRGGRRIARQYYHRDQR
jgi:hypothetical protein